MAPTVLTDVAVRVGVGRGAPIELVQDKVYGVGLGTAKAPVASGFWFEIFAEVVVILPVPVGFASALTKVSL